MAVGSTVLAIALAIIAVTSARGQDKRSPCIKDTIEFTYDECVYHSGQPPASLKDYQKTAEQNKLVIEQYCSHTFTNIVHCMESHVKKFNCEDATQILNKVAATGGACTGNKPAAWLKGLINRIGDQPKQCVMENTYCNYTPNADGGTRLDESIDCLKADVKNSCAKVTLFTMELVPMLIFDSKFGAHPSKAKLESLRMK